MLTCGSPVGCWTVSHSTTWALGLTVNTISASSARRVTSALENKQELKRMHELLKKNVNSPIQMHIPVTVTFPISRQTYKL